jgi:hypothetical protein
MTAVLNRQLQVDGLAPVNHKRVYPIMQAHDLLLARHYMERPDFAHNGQVATLRANIRWCSDGFEFTWLEMARRSSGLSSSTLMIGRSSPGEPWQTPASAARTSAP